MEYPRTYPLKEAAIMLKMPKSRLKRYTLLGLCGYVNLSRGRTLPRYGYNEKHMKELLKKLEVKKKK